MCCNGFFSDVFLVVLSVLFPPLPVWIRRGFCTGDSLINVCLFILGYFPGLIHSWYIIAKYPPYSDIYYVYRSDIENQTTSRVANYGAVDPGHQSTSNITNNSNLTPLLQDSNHANASNGSSNQIASPPPYDYHPKN